MFQFFIRHPIASVLLVSGSAINVGSRVNDAYTLWNAGLSNQMWEAIGAAIFFLAVMALLYRWDKERRSESIDSSPRAARAPREVQSTDPLAHALHLLDSNGVHLGVDKKKKMVQIGFHLKNSSGMPLRYAVKNATSIIDGRASMTQNFTSKGGVVGRDGVAKFLCVPIPYTLTKDGAQASATIVYQYGPAGPSESPVREATYRFEISISGTGGWTYLIAEENDAKI